MEENKHIIHLNITIPVNTTATVHIPNKNHSVIKLNGVIIQLKDIKKVVAISEVHVGSGTYNFEAIN